MAVKRMDHVGVVVHDLEAAKAFFGDLGLKVHGEATAEGDWVDRVVGLEGVHTAFAMMETPDGHSRLELIEFHSPTSPEGDQRAPASAPGIRHLTFAVDDLDATLVSLDSHGAELVGEVENYRDIFRLCYVRGPEGIIIELAEDLG